jgi:hypothetical protein
MAALAFFIIGKVVKNRVPAEDEVAGLDIPEMGVLGYSADPGPRVGTEPSEPGAGAPSTVPALARSTTGF